MLGYPPTLGVFKRLAHSNALANLREVPEEAGTIHPSSVGDINVVEIEMVAGRTILSRIGVKNTMQDRRVRIEGVGEWDVIVPPTVYPPKEDTLMLCDVLSKLSAKSDSKAMEIGCGSGMVTMVLSTLGWEVTACDVNPFAVACTRGNLEANGLSDRASIIEADFESDFLIPEDTELVVWNLPYLDEDEENFGVLEKIEEAALADIPKGGWGGVLLKSLEKSRSDLPENIMVILVMRTDPVGSSRVLDWEQNGWSWRTLRMERFGDEKLEVIGFWRTGSGKAPTILDSCTSTMDEAESLPLGGWQRILSKKQTKGRGRRGSDWVSEEGGLFATWSLEVELLEKIPPGLIQTSIGAIVSEVLGADMKWPNDIVDENGVKIGGVLVESSNNNSIRVGVGANRSGFAEGGVVASGWEETIGGLDFLEIFHRVDRAISSTFENKKMISATDSSKLLQSSWKALSRFLSRGVLTTLDGEMYRPTGMNKSGELELVGIEERDVFEDLDGIIWILPNH